MHDGGRVAIITGASSGIGRELAKVLARQGYRVGLVARRRDDLASLAAEIAAAGDTAALEPADVGNREQAVTAIRALAQRLGPVDLLVANAGVGLPTLLDPVNTEEVETMIRVNLLGVVYAIEAVLPEMLRRGRGHLAAVSSLAAYKGLPGDSGYCASKAAVNTYMEGLRIQLRPRGIAVTTIAPGFVHTPMTAKHPFRMPMVMSAAEAARRIARALAARKKVYAFPWPIWLLMRLTAWLPDRLLWRIVGPFVEKRAETKRPS